MKAIVTGATGCVGRNIVDELLKNNWEVIILHRKSSNLSRLKGLKIDCIEVDLHDSDSVLNAIPAGVDAIFHAAGNVSHWHFEAEEQWKDNVLSTRNLVHAAQIRKVKKFIFTSTGATFKYANKPMSEILNISSDYIRTKLLAELEVREGIKNGLEAVIIRPAIVLGKYDYNNYAQIFQRINEGKFLVVLPGIIAFNHATDVAQAHLKAFTHGKSGVAYYLFGNRTNWSDIYNQMAKIMNVKYRFKKTPVWILYILAYVMLGISYINRKRPLLTPQLVSLLNSKEEKDPESEIPKTKMDLGYQPATIDEILNTCYSWMKKEGIIKDNKHEKTKNQIQDNYKVTT